MTKNSASKTVRKPVRNTGSSPGMAAIARRLEALERQQIEIAKQAEVLKARIEQSLHRQELSSEGTEDLANAVRALLDHFGRGVRVQQPSSGPLGSTLPQVEATNREPADANGRKMLGRYRTQR